MGGADAPATPDYVGAAKATAQGSVDAVNAQTSANRVNQVTPYGSLQYFQDPNATDPSQGWTQVQTLSPAQQQMLNLQNISSIGLDALATKQLDPIRQALSHNITMADLPVSEVNPGETGYQALMRRLQPQIDISHNQLVTQLANQGITPGSQAYNDAMRVQNESENDLRSQAALQGIDIGQNAQNQRLGLLQAIQQNPIALMSILRNGGGVTNPTFSGVPAAGLAQSPDILGATQAQANYNQGKYNAGVAQNNSTMSGLFGLGAAGLNSGLFSGLGSGIAGLFGGGAGAAGAAADFGALGSGFFGLGSTAAGDALPLLAAI